MQEYNAKKDEEVLAEIYRNCKLALQSIEDILPECEDGELKAEMQSQSEGYERISAKASAYAKNKQIELKEPNPLKKMMMWGSIKMSTLADDSRSHIADMMVQGTVMGINALRTSRGDTKEDENDEVVALLDEMIEREEEFEKRWKEYL